MSKNNHALPENAVLMHPKLFLIRNLNFQENANTERKKIPWVWKIMFAGNLDNIKPYKNMK